MSVSDVLSVGVRSDFQEGCPESLGQREEASTGKPSTRKFESHEQNFSNDENSLSTSGSEAVLSGVLKSVNVLASFESTIPAFVRSGSNPQELWQNFRFAPQDHEPCRFRQAEAPDFIKNARGNSLSRAGSRSLLAGWRFLLRIQHPA